MELLEILLVAEGVSLDICAVMMCYGALLPEVHKREVFLGCVVLSAWQLIAFQAGNLLTCIPAVGEVTGQVTRAGAVFSIFIFLCIGGYMFYKALERKPFLERRKDSFSVKEIWLLSVGCGIDAFFAGLGLGYLDSRLWQECAAILGSTVLAIVIGIYVGYRFGWEQKTKIYVLGGILMIAAGAEVLFRSFF